ncbi:cytochrome c oxidase assembly protein COX16 homolog, mitochondrial-like [Ornithodoros turicata]
MVVMFLTGLRNAIQAFSRRKFIKVGVPFMVLVVGGSFALKQFTSLRFEVTGITKVTPEEAAKFGVKMKPKGEVTLESVYEDVQKMDTESWENIRGPRPWEENNEYNKILEERQKQVTTKRNS